ncbi:MAG TPA: GyrI-like domain-containing protein [Caulobacteraceae bacterium]|nr:GyrI-like domain-containing protein [Caulobacteraceae bacterium]
MPVELTQVTVVATPIAAVGGWAPRNGLGQAIVSRLDKVYAVLRARQVTGLGHNVVVYKAAAGAPADVRLLIEVGVQTPEPISPEGEVIASATPAGRAATVAHVGPYDGIPATGDAAIAQMDAMGLKRASVSWEVYGDWEEDPARLRTDLYWLLAD